MPQKKRPGSRQQSRAAQRAANRRVLSRGPRPWWQSPTALGGGALSIVVIVVIVIVLIGQGGGQTSTSGRTPVSPAVLTAVTQPDAAALAQVGAGNQKGNLARLPGSSVVAGPSGKPAVIYVGAEYCPYCAAERWVIVIALSRFGSFSGLQQITSSSSDVFPNTNTFTFLGASYTSSWIDFQSSELEDRNRQPLESPSAQVASAFQTFDRAPYTQTAQGFPFLDIGGRFVLSNTSYSPQLLQGLSWDQIANQLASPGSPVAQAILGNANIITAAVCNVTNDQPQTVCGAQSIQTIETGLRALTPPSG